MKIDKGDIKMANEFVPYFHPGVMIPDNKRTFFTVRVRDCWKDECYGLKAFCFEKSERIPDKASALRKIQYVFQPPRYSIVSVYEGEYKMPSCIVRTMGVFDYGN